MVTETPVATQHVFVCPFCGAENQLNPRLLDKLQVRCKRCKLPLQNRRHVRFRHLDPTVYRHPLDQEALAALQKLPGLQGLLQKIQSFSDQAYCEAFFAANSLRVSEQQYPDLYAKLSAACSTLGMTRVPNLYLSPVDLAGVMGVQSYSGGIEQPFIVLSSRLLEVFDDQDLLIALGHELGHIHGGYLPYKVAADYLPLLLSKTYKKTPLEAVADTVTLPIQQALLSWRLKANLSADRCAMLITQDQRAIFSYLMKLSGGEVGTKASLEAFVDQARNLNTQVVYTWIDKYWQQLLYNEGAPGFPVWRAAELTQWSREKLKGYGYDEIVKIFSTTD